MGIVHRDVKPENVFVDPEDRPLLADFGLARSMTGDSQLTMAGVAIGTPAYMPPEQIEGASLDARRHLQPGSRRVGDADRSSSVGGEAFTRYSTASVTKQLPDVRDLRMTCRIHSATRFPSPSKRIRRCAGRARRN
jgi:serine/threonine protein kinase